MFTLLQIDQSGIEKFYQELTKSDPNNLTAKIYKVFLLDYSSVANAFYMSFSILAALFLVLNVIRKLYVPAANPEDGIKAIQRPLDIWQLLQYIFLLIAILAFRQIMYGVEILMIKFSSGMYTNWSATTNIIGDATTKLVKIMAQEKAATAAEQGAAIATLGLGTQAAKDLLKPENYTVIFILLHYGGALLNLALIFFAYAERAVGLVVINFVAPLILALSILDTYRGLLKNLFLTLLFFLFIYPVTCIVFGACDSLYLILSNVFNLLGNNDSTGSMLNSTANTALSLLTDYDIYYKLPLLIAIIALKFRLLSFIMTLLTRLFQA